MTKKETLERIERLLEQILEEMKNRRLEVSPSTSNHPIIPKMPSYPLYPDSFPPYPDSYPVYKKNMACPVCGLGADGPMAYVCPRNDCPGKITCTTTSYHHKEKL